MNTPNQHQWRMAIANKIADYYQAYAEVAAGLTVGSLANNLADQFTDVDMVIYWHTAPTDKQRRVVAEKMNGLSAELSESSLENDPALFMWEDVFYVGGGRTTGLKIDLNHVLLSSLDKLMNDVMLNHEHNRHKSMVLYSLKRSHIHFGADILAPKFEQIQRCPRILAEKLVRENLDLWPKSSYKMLAFREDWLFYNQLMVQGCASLLFVLYGLNEEFPPGRFKHFGQVTTELPIKPANLSEILVTILRGETELALPTLFDLAIDVYDLVDKYFPEIDTSDARTWLDSGRAELFELPIIIN